MNDLNAPDQYIPHGYDPALYRLRHSAAHIMAQAVSELFPEAHFAIGPPIEDRFYYDFDLPRTLTPDDLQAIEERMRAIIRGGHPFVHRAVTPDEARQLFANQPFKLELIEGLAAGQADENGEPTDSAADLTVYTQDSFTDLCRGPHVARTSDLNPNAIKLLAIAGAYWRGDEANPMLQRVYGTAWRTPEELADYLWRLEEAAKRDHRTLGKQLDLFSTNDDVGAGLILWHPRGGMMRKTVENFWEHLHETSGYDFVFTPHIGKSTLWETSGHLDFYAENMYAPIELDSQDYYLKPMNCPFHMHIYKSRTRSYRDLPLRFAEKGTVYRYERSGVLHGLLRVRGFTQDDAHHFCTPEQVTDEIDFALGFCLKMLRAFGFEDFTAYLSTRPHDKYVGELSDWQVAESVLEAALQRAELPYSVDPGGGAFYGPKIDLKVRDALGREWQLSTIQFDFNLPERFDITYTAADGSRRRPYMVHRALLGSMERFFGVLIEHYAGAFPVWLCPTQVMVIPITDAQVDYAKTVVQTLKAEGLRAEVDSGSSRMGAKIREAQELKIPYMLVVGKREADQGAVSVRLRTEEDLGAMPLDEFIQRAKGVITAKTGL